MFTYRVEYRGTKQPCGYEQHSCCVKSFKNELGVCGCMSHVVPLTYNPATCSHTHRAQVLWFILPTLFPHPTYPTPVQCRQGCWRIQLQPHLAPFAAHGRPCRAAWFPHQLSLPHGVQALTHLFPQHPQALKAQHLSAGRRECCIVGCP